MDNKNLKVKDLKGLGLSHKELRLRYKHYLSNSKGVTNYLNLMSETISDCEAIKEVTLI